MSNRSIRKKPHVDAKMGLGGIKSNKIIILPNADKKWHESWTPDRDLLNIPHPCRVLCMGPPNVGKSTLAKNILLKADPPYQELYVIHCDPEFTQEYDDLGDFKMLEKVPEPAFWRGAVKTLVILDDLEFKAMGKKERKHLDRLFGYVSTHKNISVILCAQEAFSVPTVCRRMANVWVLWRQKDTDSLNAIGRKIGLSVRYMRLLFDRLLTEPRDFIMVDGTPRSPAPYRKNAYQKIDIDALLV